MILRLAVRNRIELDLSTIQRKTKIQNKNNQQMLRYVLLGFVGLIFAFGILVFVMVDLSPFSDADLYGRTKIVFTPNKRILRPAE
jgi:hypothetical protein